VPEHLCASAIVIEAILSFLLAVNMMGGGLRDSLDPTLRKRL